MNTILNSALTLTYNQLSTFSGLDNFWQVFDTAFGTQYNRSGAEILRLKWLSGDFSQLPQIEILDSSILSGANGAYATSTNKIYLSANFIATSTPEAISAVLLEEIGHFIDAQINQIDTPGDEGEKFSALLRGQNLTTQELDRINTENDWANITVDGKIIAVEQAAPIVLTVTTTADQNDGSATGGLSLRDAILIANADTTNDYIIELQGGQTYSLSIKNTAALNDGGDEQAAVRGDLDILAGGKITIKSVGAQKAIIDATNLKTSFASGFGDSAIDVKDNAYLILNGVTITGASVGAVWIGINSTAEISNSLITHNVITVASAFYESNQDGSGITNYGTLLLKDSTISNNKAARYGGGIFNAGIAIASINNTTISGNTADKNGGGIFNFGTATITNSTISGNKTNEYGGGIINTGTATISNTTISGNTANQSGGGIFSSQSTSATVTGKIYLNNSTITNNTADLDSNNTGNGGGISNVSGAGEVYAKNTIIAGNFDTPNNNSAGLGAIYNSDIDGSINGNNYNLIGNKTGGSGTIGTGTDIVNSNILLSTLQNNGGTTQTHALLTGSPAINAGNNSLIPLDTNDIDGDGNTTETIPFDQRGTGFSRIANNRVDIGAFEFQGIPSPIISINNISVVEGNSGTKTGTVTVNLNAVTDKTVTVDYTTANNTAIAGNDYTAISGQLSFTPGETTKTINVNILGDNIAEANKSFFVNLSNPTNSFLNQTNVQGIVTITDDEPHPIILGSNSIPNPAITLTVNTTADQNDGSATGGLSLRDAILIANSDTANKYIINLTGGATYKLTAFSLTDTLGGDLDIFGNVTIQSTGTEPATIDASGLTNPDSVFYVANYLNLGNIVVTGGSTSGTGGGIYIGQNATARLFNTTVKNNSSSSVGGGIFNGGLVVLVNSTIADNQGFNGGGIYNTGQAILLGTTIKNNGATAGGGVSNYGTLTISNSTIYNNTVQYFGGGIDHNAGTLSLINSTMSGNYGYYSGGIDANDGVVNIFNSTITNNTSTANYSGAAGGINNTNPSGGRASLNLKNTIVAGNMGANPNILGSININNNNLIGGDAKLGPLQDNGNGIFTYALLSGSPAINAGNNDLIATDIFDIDIDGNNTETIPFDNRGSGYTRIFGGTVDIGAFEFQSAPNLSLSINDVTLTEGNSGTKNATFTVTLSGETFQPVTVNYATANGTATAGSDYTATTGTLIFNVNPGETSKQITVPILGDTLAESNETFFINLSNPINATIVDTQGIATITNDDSVIDTYTPIESVGNTKLVKDAANKYFTQAGTATPIAIKAGGQQIYQDIYAGWQTLAAETVNGDNQVLWKNVSGNFLHIWHLDSNWNWVSSEGNWGLNSAEALTQETKFGIDANGDGKIGYAIIESAGNTTFLKDAANKYFTQVGTATPIAIKAGGQQIYQDIYAGWQTLAAETVNGDNQVLWKNVSGNFLHIWHLDSNWNWVSSEGNWGLNSAEALTQETKFGVDANGDGKIGYAIIESAGNTTFLKDAANKYFTQVGTATPIAIKAGGQQIYQDIYAGWQTLAAETVNGDNQVLWKNVSGNFLHIWHLDSNWNWVSSEGNWGLNSAEALTQETNFGVDANGDGKIGYAIIESAGNTTFLKDAANKYFTQVGTATPIAIKAGGQQIYQDIYAGWQTLAAETVNGDNQVLWKNVSGNFLHIWHLDSNWNWVSSEGNWGLNSAEALTQETKFGVDANGDGKIGYAIIESAGNTTFLKDAANKYFTQVGTATPIAIKAGGQQIYQDIYAGWQTLAAETVNGDNQVLWKNVSGNFLHIWHLDSNWNWVSSEGNWGLNSAEALTQETNFGVDANGDGKIGYAIIESAGNTTFLKDAANKYFTQVGTATPITIKAGGQQIYQDIYAGWQTLATETVNGDNQVLWKNVSGNFLHIWHLDSNWNWVSSEGNWGLNSAEALTQETNFGVDANGDGKIGSPSSLTLTGTSGNDILIGGANSDTFNGGLGNDTLYLGLNDNSVDNVNYTLGDATDTVYQFVHGVGGDKLNFTGIANFDVITSGTSTLVRVGDGIAANTGFDTGQLLVTLSETSGFTSANANINLFGGNFLFN